MGEKFYRDLDEFRAKYPTDAQRDAVLRTMNAEQILRLARACATLQEAISYARYAQAAAEREAA